ncbi:MAG TPA: DedA family protein [Streptosporangiaceae bacterium]
MVLTGPPVNAFSSLQPDSLLSYLAAVLLPALDAIFPVVPSETVVLALGVATAGSTDPRIALLIGCAALGAFAGDNLCYLLGRRFGPFVRRRFFATDRGRQRLDWAERSLRRFGPQVIVVCRFVPGGRTAVTLCCGLIGYPRRRFAAATAVAGVIWAVYTFMIGRLGGKAFEERPWAGLLLAFGISAALALVIEAVRRIRRARQRRQEEPCRQGEPCRQEEERGQEERDRRAGQPDASPAAGAATRAAAPEAAGRTAARFED